MWTSYRKCTSFASFCNISLGLLLICMWAACFQLCLSRLNADNDLAAPLWTGIICVFVGSFGMVASCLYWKRTNETLLSILTSLTVLCSAAAVVLCVHASFKEHLLYESQGRPPETLAEGILGVAFFGLMAVFSFVVFLISVLWTCACCFRRYCAKVRGEQGISDANLEAFILAYQKTRAQSSSQPSSTAAPRRSSSHLNSTFDLSARAQDESQPAAFNVPSFPESPRQVEQRDENEPTRKTSVGPQFASVTAAELRWWDYYTPPKETVGFGGF